MGRNSETLRACLDVRGIVTVTRFLFSTLGVFLDLCYLMFQLCAASLLRPARSLVAYFLLYARGDSGAVVHTILWYDPLPYALTVLAPGLKHAPVGCN